MFLSVGGSSGIFFGNQVRRCCVEVWSAMTFVGVRCVCAMGRDSPEPTGAWIDGNASSDDGNAAASKCFPEPVDAHNNKAREIAKDIVELGRLSFAHGSIPAQRRLFVKHVFVKYHFDKHCCGADVAGEVVNDSYALLALSND